MDRHCCTYYSSRRNTFSSYLNPGRGHNIDALSSLLLRGSIIKSLLLCRFSLDYVCHYNTLIMQIAPYPTAEYMQGEKKLFISRRPTPSPTPKIKIELEIESRFISQLHGVRRVGRAQRRRGAGRHRRGRRAGRHVSAGGGRGRAGHGRHRRPACALQLHRVLLVCGHRGLPVLELEPVHLHVKLSHLQLGRDQLRAQLLLLAFHLSGKGKGGRATQYIYI